MSERVAGRIVGGVFVTGIKASYRGNIGGSRSQKYLPSAIGWKRRRRLREEVESWWRRAPQCAYAWFQEFCAGPAYSLRPDVFP